MDWQLVASYFTVKSTDIFSRVHTAHTRTSPPTQKKYLVKLTNN